MYSAKDMKNGHTRSIRIKYLKIESQVIKVHSNLYRYGAIEFVSQAAPAVGGYIVEQDNTPPMFYTAEEFNYRFATEE